ncbi:MAG TPA: GNAT family N-acyltransferase [Gaiellaceae bacterium]|nr:GNAT family N-acyltransferase [Gaiellaceae bacterium]
MQNAEHLVDVPRTRQEALLGSLLRGYRFRVCEDADSAARALDVRRRVYRESCGYDVPVPDAYDGRSWLLLAEHVRSGDAVGSMRVTPRSGGPFEAEEYLDLPHSLTLPTAVEVTRFAILPEHRHSRRFLPVVALGLYKLVCRYTRELGTTDIVICAKPERSWAYQWLAFTRSGITCRYGKLDGAEHELLTCDVRGGMEKHRDHRYWGFVFETEHPEIVLPATIPALGIGRSAARASEQLRRIA